MEEQPPLPWAGAEGGGKLLQSSFCCLQDYKVMKLPTESGGYIPDAV
jgi:hypothetical protein